MPAQVPEPVRAVKPQSEYVEDVKRQIRKFIDEGYVPPTVKTFSELQHVAYTGEYTTGLFGEGDREMVDQHAWRLLNYTSFAPGEVYVGVRYAKEGEDSGDSRIPMVIIKKIGPLLIIPDYDPIEPKPYPGDIKPGYYGKDEVDALLTKYVDNPEAMQFLHDMM